MNSCTYDFPVLLIQSGLDRDFFGGVDRLLAAQGVASARVLPDQPLPMLAAANRVILVSEVRSVMSRLSIRQAIGTGATVILARCEPGDTAEQTVVADLLGSQLVVMDMFHESMPRPAHALLQAILGVLAHEAVTRHSPLPGSDTQSLCRAVLPLARATTLRPVVVNCVVCQDSPVGGVSTWAMRLAQGFAENDYGFDMRTLFIATDPEAWDRFRDDLPVDEITDACVIDPADDQVKCLGDVRAAIERLSGSHAPAIVIPNYSDITYAAAMQLARHGTRVLAITHTDDAYYRSIIDTYTRVDAVVGVSKACMKWLRARVGPAMDAATFTSAQIVYGVPVAESPRTVEADGPLMLAYVGRMVQTQKRITDLLRLVDELDLLGVEFVLHMIGDGVDLPGWRKAWESRGARRGRVEFHGRRDPAWVQTFLQNVDVSVLVSEAEGTSITMLEAMGAGVVPAVTAVSSGVDEWVTDGVSGVVVPVGEPEEMARRLAVLAGNRTQLRQMGHAAWRHARDHISINAMCRQYAQVFRSMVNRRLVIKNEPACDHGLRLNDYWRWPKLWCEDESSARRNLDRWLAEAGYVRPAWGTYMPGCDVVIVDSNREPATPALARQMNAWRAEGMGVVVWPHLLCPGLDDERRDGPASAADRLTAAAEEAVSAGCRRLVVYGIGKHTRRVPGVFTRGLPFVGLMDDVMPPWEMMFGLPIVRSEAVMEELRPDAVILSSDAWEEAMWGRTAWLRSAGVRVMTLYGTYEKAGEQGCDQVCSTAARTG